MRENLTRLEAVMKAKIKSSGGRQVGNGRNL